jgi:hypothetical protein
VVRVWALLPLLLTGCSGGDPTATDPARLFEDAFVNPPAEVEILADGGTMVRGLDGWLVLRPKYAALQPRHGDEYVDRDCAEPLAWFERVTGDPALRVGSGLSCRERVDSRFKFDNGRWLVTDRNQGLVYYRIWKHYD